MRERPRLWRLEVIDTRRRVIRIEYQLDGFANLAGIVLERAACLEGQRARIVEFHLYGLGPWPCVVLLAILAGCAVAALAEGHLRGVASCVVFSIGVGAMLFGEVRSIKVEPSEVVLQYFLWARRIPYTDIVAVDLDDVPVGSDPGNPTPRSTVPKVIIMTDREEEIELPTPLEGTVRLYDSLSAAWEQAKAAGKQTPDPRITLPGSQ